MSKGVIEREIYRESHVSELMNEISTCLKKVCRDLGMAVKAGEYPVEMGYLVKVPIYEGHKRGRNWLAVIEKSPTAPGGLARTFMEVGRGGYYYSVKNLKRGDVLEWGADYYTGGGHKHPKRLYSVVLEVRPDKLITEDFETPGKAFKYRDSLFRDVKTEIENLLKKKESLLKELKEVEEKLEELQKEQEMTGKGFVSTAQREEMHRLEERRRRLEIEIDRIDERIEKIIEKYPFAEGWISEKGF